MRVVKLIAETIDIVPARDGGHTWSPIFSNVAEAMKFLRMDSTIEFLKEHRVKSVDMKWVEIDKPDDYQDMAHEVDVIHDEETGDVKLDEWDYT